VIQPLGPIKGVPDDLTRALNERFRQITTSTGAKATAGARSTRINDYPAAQQNAGDFFVEMDRGNALYQIQAGQWLLVAGSLVGLNADKPTDLGMSDKGFLYRSTDTKQDFRWSGTAWGETTTSAIVATQSVVTGSRALGTVYQNTTGRPMCVVASAVGTSTGTAATMYLEARSDAATPPTTVVATSQGYADTNLYGTRPQVVFWVMPGNYYKVDRFGIGVAMTVSCWTEWY
jgi:hypothetical protein